MAYTTNPYCDLQQVYYALDLSSTSQSADGAWIQELINEAQADIDRELGFSFQTDGTTGSPASRVYDGNDDLKLFLYPERCLSFTQVLETTYTVLLGSNGVFQNGTTQTVDITADCVLGPPNMQNGFYTLRRKTGLPFIQGIQNYQVSGIFGRPSIPPDISRACVRLAVHYYKMRDTNYADQLIEQGLVRQKYSKTMPLDVVEILDKYKPRLFFV